MKKGVFIFIGVILFLILIIATCSNSDEKANKLYTEAVTLVENASKIEEENVNEALSQYQEAYNKIEKLISENGKTKTAVDVVAGEKKIGKFTYTQLKEQVLPSIEQKANATKDLNSLLLFLLDKAEDATYSKCLVLHEIAKAERLSENFTKANQYLATLEENASLLPENKTYLQASIYLLIAIEHYHLRNIEKAKLYINNASVLAQNQEHKKMKERLLLSTLSAYAEISQFEKAKRLVYKLTDDYLEDAAYFDIADNYAQFQQVDSAFETAKRIISPDLKSRAFTNISKQLILQGRENTAEKYLDYCQDILLDSIDLKEKAAKARVEIAECYNILGNERKTLKIIKDIIRDIDDVDNYHKSTPLKVSLAILYNSMNRNGDATRLLEEASALAETSLAISKVALAFAKVHNFERAYQTAQKIKDSERKLETLVQIATIQVVADVRINKETAVEIQKIIQM